MTHVGFTGTQVGMTTEQRVIVNYTLGQLEHFEQFISYHHGDCVGADNDFDDICIVRNTDWDTMKSKHMYLLHLHPPDNDSARAFVKEKQLPYDNMGRGGIFSPVKPYLERNHDIVNESEFMIATPQQDKEKLRSGTWATIRYAQKKKKPLIIIGPTGRTYGFNDFFKKIENPLYF
jgi:hypothetical protein